MAISISARIEALEKEACKAKERASIVERRVLEWEKVYIEAVAKVKHLRENIR